MTCCSRTETRCQLQGKLSQQQQLDTKALQGLEDLGLAKAGALGTNQDSPLIYLAKPPKGKAKYLDVTDFLNLQETEQGDEDAVGSKDGVDLLLRPSGAKAKLDNISQASWNIANVRILAELLSTGQLPSDQLADYLAYTVKICQLADRHTWKSVLSYDRDYRHKQALCQCRWGTELMHLRSVTLVDKSNQARMANLKNGQNLGPKAPNGAKRREYNKPASVVTEKSPICRQYNQGECTFVPCKFRHVCLTPGCQQAHTIFEHFGQRGQQ